MKTIEKQKKTEEAVELIRTDACCGELSLELALYRVALKRRSYYLVSSSDAEASAAEVLSSDRGKAERLYLKLVEGSVPPCTLREIVFDLLEGEYLTAL